jgi:hypothetical protein
LFLLTKLNFYSQPNHRGGSACVYPGDTYKCHPGFYKSRFNLGGGTLIVQSVAKGCFSSNVLKPDPLRNKNIEFKSALIGDGAGRVVGGSATFGKTRVEEENEEHEE